MVEKFEKILNTIKKDKGNIILFALIKLDTEAIDKWSLILSADWVKEEKQNSNFSYIFNLLSQHLNDTEKKSIARIGIFSKEEKLVQLITSALKVKEGSTTYLKENRFNGFYIHEAYIFESTRIK